MTAIIPSQRVANCGICWEQANPNDSDPKIRPVTHIEGENHDGFHARCLSNWLKTSPISNCPTCRRGIDRSTILSRTERVMQILNPAIESGFSAFTAMTSGLVMMNVALLSTCYALNEPNVFSKESELPISSIGLISLSCGFGIGVRGGLSLLDRFLIEPLHIENGILGVLGTIVGQFICLKTRVSSVNIALPLNPDLSAICSAGLAAAGVAAALSIFRSRQAAI